MSGHRTGAAIATWFVTGACRGRVGRASAVEAALDRFGRVDVLVNNAGYGLMGAVEETSDRETRAVFDVSLFGLLRVTRLGLGILRA